jgi:hypothetical protein
MASTQPGPAGGSSTQAKISLDIAALINTNHINLWFASEFNPIRNQETSNPLLTFRELDFAEDRPAHGEIAERGGQPLSPGR